jgi:hypothetical protein
VRCPYCVSEIADEALVCPVCTRDLYLFKPLLERIDKLEKRVAEQDALEARLALLEAGSVSATTDNGASVITDDESVVPPLLREWLQLWLAPLVLLLAAHGLIILVYDLNTLYLRLVSLLIPLPFGFVLTREYRGRVLPLVMLVTLAGLAVLGMSAATGWLDGTPVLPEGAREWREFIEYAASIGFSYLSGMLVGRLVRLRRRTALRQASMAAALSRLVHNGSQHTVQVQQAVQKFNEFGGAIVAAATTLMSIYTGLKGVIGN